MIKYKLDIFRSPVANLMSMFPYPPVTSLPGHTMTCSVSHIDEEEGGCFWLQREEGAADDISANLTPGTATNICCKSL
jgi:hypothetical protein